MNKNDELTNENIINVNETIYKNVNELITQNANMVSTLANLIENQHIISNNYLSNVNTTLKNQLNAQSALIADNQLNNKNNFTAIMNTMATQSYLKTVYDSIIGTVSTQTYLTSVYNNIMTAVNAISQAQNPCKTWIGSINENGLCKCSYKGDNKFCPNFNSCCEFIMTKVGVYQYYRHDIACANGIFQTGSQTYYVEAESYANANNTCGGAKYYTNL
ncbi:Hypothetical_protein [Hexamita inflata]|uniref:Hypothetical_protein n=1 Tax=Hexamita inflata TaxID=28002 RepID=A0AA86QQC1_9EUKA|nr:Hypothetical protein HINF_LOCUS51559 [Hexamita inflata]